MEDKYVCLSGDERFFKQFIDRIFGVKIDCILKYR